MNLKKTLEKINKDREKTEGVWVFCLWADPELYEDYWHINENNDKTLKNKDAIFYFKLGKALYKNGFRTFDPVTLETFLTDKPEMKKQYETYGGYSTVKELLSLVDVDNEQGYFDSICKMNSLSTLAEKYEEIFEDVDRFKNASNEDIYTTFDALNSSVSIASAEKIEDLVLTDSFIESLNNGDDMGLKYNKYAPLLNYITLGISPGMYMVGGHSGTGKSSFVFGCILMSLHYAGISSAIISNEMGVETYKVLLLEHILTQELDYWDLPRKKIRMGGWTEEQAMMVERAKEISEKKYSDIKFIRLYGNSIGKVSKYMRKMKSQGVSVCLFDTFKSDDSADTSQLWQSLLMDSRKLDNLCRKYGISCVTTYQLALHTVNQRYLDATCLSNAKQIKEVYETMVYFRPIWDDEFNGGKYDIHPYSTKAGSKTKQEVILDKNKKYLLCFVDKTRADEDKKVLVYEWKAHFNVWKEIGFATVINDHMSR